MAFLGFEKQFFCLENKLCGKTFFGAEKAHLKQTFNRHLNGVKQPLWSMSFEGAPLSFSSCESALNAQNTIFQDLGSQLYGKKGIERNVFQQRWLYMSATLIT